jgi:nucleoside-diphosphate-sugar epimerase
MATEERTVLLVGGAGYVGSVITGHLLRAGWGVRCLDQLIYKNESCAWPYLSDPR